MDETEASYAIIKHNFTTRNGSEVVRVVKGIGGAEQAVEEYNRKLTAQQKEDGWRHYHQETHMKPGTNPEAATEDWWQEREIGRARAERRTRRGRKLQSLLHRSQESSAEE